MTGSRPQALVLHLALAATALLCLVPLLWMVSASFMASGEANAFPPPLLPQHPTLEQFRTLFTRLHLTRAVANSTLIAVATTLVSLLVNALAGYGFAKLRFAGRDRLFQLLLAGLVIPVQVGMLPLFLLLRGLHLVNTPLGVMIPGFASIFGIFLIRQFALSIPDDLLDAARIDGAGEMHIFRRVVLPLLGPVLVTQAAFTFLTTWNDFLWPLIVLNDAHRYTLPVALANLSGEHVQDTELMMAGAVVTVAPVLVLFAALQRYYVRGVLMGSVKG